MSKTTVKGASRKAKDSAFAILSKLAVGLLLRDTGFVAYNYFWGNLKILAANRESVHVGIQKFHPDLVFTLAGNNYLNIEFETCHPGYEFFVRLRKYFLGILAFWRTLQSKIKFTRQEYPTIKQHIVAGQGIKNIDLKYDELPEHPAPTIFYLRYVDVEKELLEIKTKVAAKRPDSKGPSISCYIANLWNSYWI
jgi:hypothetical protein